MSNHQGNFVKYLPQDEAVAAGLGVEEGFKLGKSNDNKQVQFSTKQVWLDLRDNYPVVDWHKVIWFPQFEPKRAFILWLAVNRKLSTQDRLQKWSSNRDPGAKASDSLTVNDHAVVFTPIFFF
ncbi:uncharacterized protein [Rutidosis leptorrhynchoides]|uniref:uncharacterized protein n=1 Tax=Rutidosis leptorrhynchoides TaxID=125765 RepID=UPI003A98DE88